MAEEIMGFENGMALHHVGYVVPSIEDAAPGFVRSMALGWDGRIIHDPLQTVYVSFFFPQTAGNAVIELVQPEDTDSAVARFLQKGGGLHHLCYEVDSLDEQLRWTRINRDLIARQPMPAAAFEGRRIAWVYTRNKLLVEFLERCPR